MAFEDYLIGWLAYLLGALVCMRVSWIVLDWLKNKHFALVLKIIVVSLLFAPGINQLEPLTIAPALMVIMFQVLSKGENLIAHGVIPMIITTIVASVLVIIDERKSLKSDRRDN